METFSRSYLSYIVLPQCDVILWLRLENGKVLGELTAAYWRASQTKI